MASVQRGPRKKQKSPAKPSQKHQSRMHDDHLQKKKIAVELLASEVEESRRELLNREKQLNLYAQRLVEKGSRLKARTSKLQAKRSNFQRNFEEQERMLLRELNGTVGNAKSNTFMGKSVRQVASYHPRGVQWEYSETSVIEKQIKRAKKNIARVTESEKQVKEKLAAHLKRLTKMRDEENAIDVRMHVMKDEFNVMLAAKDKYVQILQSHIQAVGSNLSSLKRREYFNTQVQSGEMGRFTVTVKKAEKLAQREEQKYIETQRAASLAKRAKRRLAELQSEIDEYQGKTELLKSQASEKDEKIRENAKRLRDLEEALAQVIQDRKKTKNEINVIKGDLSKSQKQVIDDETDATTFMEIAEDIERQDQESKELSKKLALLEQTPPEDVSTSPQVTELKQQITTTATELTQQINSDSTEITTLTQTVSQIEDKLNKQRAQQQAVESQITDASTFEPDLDLPADVPHDPDSVAIQIKTKADERQSNIDALKQAIQDLEQRHQQLHQSITKRKVLIKQKHQGIRDQEEFVEEEQVGLASLQDFDHLLREEITLMNSVDPKSLRSTITQWSSNLDRLFEQIDNFYLS